MNVIQSFTLKSLKRNKKWTIVTIIGIIIATAMITAVATLTGSFLDLVKNETIADTGNWHVSYSNVKVSDIPKIAGSNLTDDCMVSRNLGYAMLSGSQNANKPYLIVKEYDEESIKHYPVKLLSGRLPENDTELVISEHIESNGGVKYAIGDKLTLNIGKRIATDTQQELTQKDRYTANEKDGIQESLVPSLTKDYTIVGIIKRPGSEPRWAAGYTVITRLDAVSITQSEPVIVSITVAKLNNKLFRDGTALGESVGLSNANIEFNTELLRYYGVAQNDNFMQIISIFAGTIILIIMIASISLIYNAFAIAVSERMRQLGMLASVGATKRQKRQNVYFEGFLVGLIGIPLGILAGIGGISVTLSAVSPILKSTMPDPSGTIHLVVSPVSLAIAVALSAITIFISVYVPARRASKIMPIDAIRQSKEVKLTAKAIKTSKLSKLLFGFEGELALKNLRRSRKKYRATIISLTISLVLFLSVATAADFTKSSADIRLASQLVNYDVLLKLNSATEQTEQKVFDEIKQLDLVSDYSTSRQLNGLLDATDAQVPAAASMVQMERSNENGNTIYGVELMGLDDASFEKYVASIGADKTDYMDAAVPRVILVNHSVGYSQEQMKFFESESIVAKKGDTLRVSFDGYQKEGETPAYIDLPIGAITEQVPLGGMDTMFGNLLLVTSESAFDAMLPSVPDLARTKTRSLALKTPDGVAIDPQIAQILKAYNALDVNMINVAVDARQEKRIMVLMGVFLYGFITLISLICVANIFNTVSTNIGLRRKEFAMLRSVGMTPKSFSRMMNFESVFYGLKALLYGLPISAAIGALLYRTVVTEYSFPFKLPWLDYGVAVIAVFLIVGATMLYSSSKIKRENIIDALKEEIM